jgi:hypothetical protein
LHCCRLQIGLTQIALLILLSQYLRKVKLPIPFTSYRCGKGAAGEGEAAVLSAAHPASVCAGGWGGEGGGTGFLPAAAGQRAPT